MEMMVRMSKEKEREEEEIPSLIDSLILIDRRVDMITPMCTQLTYEGLIDEIFSIESGFTSLESDFQPIGMPSNNIGQAKGELGRKVVTRLDSQDRIYADMRDMNLAGVPPFLKERAILLNTYIHTHLFTHSPTLIRTRTCTLRHVHTHKISNSSANHTAFYHHTSTHLSIFFEYFCCLMLAI